MFAVKGWNVDAALLKPQTEVFTTSSDAAIKDTSSKKSSQKRKREGNPEDLKSSTAADSAHLEPERQSGNQKKQKIDGARLTSTQELNHASANESQAGKQMSKREKKLKRDNIQSTSTHDAKSTVTTEPQPEKQISKKSKKQKSAAQNAQTVEVQNKSTVETKSQSQKDQATKQSKAVPTLTPMQAAMRQKLISARFRHLNETLYTAPSQQAQDLFNANPDMFEDYHAGFRQQVAVWPENPVDKMIQRIRQRGSVRTANQKKASEIMPLPRTQGTCIIADCGCGDARLAQTLKTAGDLQKLNVKVLSYDLHSPSELITKADISALPTADGSVDVAIFCLALMGTNWISFIEEAYRVLHWKGELWIAEIKSRFARVGKHGKVVEHSVGNRRKQAAVQKATSAKRREQEEIATEEALQTEVDGVEKVMQETDVQGFVEVLRRRGFMLKDENASIDLSNKMFVSMEFIKAAPPTKGKGYVETSAPVKRQKFAPAVEVEVSTEDEGKTLKPCLYKIR